MPEKENNIPKNIYKYFVSFMYMNEDNKIEYGNLEIKTPTKIENFQNIEELQSLLDRDIEAIKGFEKRSLAVMGYVELNSEESIIE